MYNDRTDVETRDEIHALRYRQSSLPLSSSNTSYGGGLSSTTAQKIQTTIRNACVAFGFLVLCCWWSLLMAWFNPEVQPPKGDANTMFKACEIENWSGLDVFATLASLAVARVLQAPFAPPRHVWGIRLLLFSPLGMMVEMLWMWVCVIWMLATRRSVFATCSAVRMYRLRGLRPDIGFEARKEADKEEDSKQCAQWDYEDALNSAGKTSSTATNFPAEIQEGNSDDSISADLIAVSQRRNPLLICAAYALMIFQHYKLQSVNSGASFIKFMVFVYEIAFITTETIYLMPNPGASIADAAHTMKAFFEDASHSETNPFSASVVMPTFIGSVGGIYFFAVMLYGIPQLFSLFAVLFPEDVTNSLALTAAIALAFKMLIIIPSTFGPLALAMALPFWVMTARRVWNALLGRSAQGVEPVGSWAWMVAPLHNLQDWRRLRTAMFNYVGVILWSILFWNLVRVRDGKVPFVQHPDFAYNCSSTIRDADSWLFLR